MGVRYRNTEFVNLFGDPDRPVYGNEQLFDAPSPTPTPTGTPSPTSTPTPTPTPSSVPFSPSDLSGLEIWYDFDDTATITEDGDGFVSAVTDKSGNNYDLSASGTHRPYYNDITTIGGRGGLYFSGGTSSATRQAMTHSLGTMRTGLTANTLFAVFELVDDASLAQQTPYQITTNSGDRIWGQYFRSSDLYRASYPGKQFSNWTSIGKYPNALLWQTQEQNTPYATIQGQLNEDSGSTISDAYDLPQFNWISIGARTEFGGWADAQKGNFCEFIFYDRVLTSEEITQVVNYLKTKYDYIDW